MMMGFFPTALAVVWQYALGLSSSYYLLTSLYSELCKPTVVYCSCVVKNVSLATERLGISVLQDVGMLCLPGVVSAGGFGCGGISSTSAGTRAELNPWISQPTQWSPHQKSGHQGWDRALLVDNILCYCHTAKSCKACCLQPARDRASPCFTLRSASECFFLWMTPIDLLHNKPAVQEVLAVLLGVKGGSGWSQGPGDCLHREHMS